MARDEATGEWKFLNEKERTIEQTIQEMVRPGGPKSISVAAVRRTSQEMAKTDLVTKRRARKLHGRLRRNEGHVSRTVSTWTGKPLRQVRNSRSTLSGLWLRGGNRQLMKSGSRIKPPVQRGAESVGPPKLRTTSKLDSSVTKRLSRSHPTSDSPTTVQRIRKTRSRRNGRSVTISRPPS